MFKEIESGKFTISHSNSYRHIESKQFQLPKYIIEGIIDYYENYDGERFRCQ